MLDKREEGTRYIYGNQFESAIVPNAFSVAFARRDERESRESRPGGETTFVLVGKLFSFMARQQNVVHFVTLAFDPDQNTDNQSRRIP